MKIRLLPLAITVFAAVAAYLFAGFLLMIFGVVRAPADAKIVRAAGDIEQLRNSLAVYQVTTGDFPTTEQGLQALVVKPVIAPIPKKWKPLMEAPLPDPWGRQYVYRYRGWWNRSDEQYELFSLGEDGVESADDIGDKHPQ